MNLIAYAIPFFLAALLAEILWDRYRGTGFVRFNDAIASLAAGAISTTAGIFTKVLEVALYGFLLQYVAPWPLDPALFDFSVAGLALFALVLLAWDFLYYWHHRLGHEVNVLWAAHVVHHQSEEYNLSTALRQTSTGFLFGWLFYVPLLVAGVPTHVVATVAALDLIYQFWVHTRHIGSLGWFDRVFVSPSNHRVHHAQNKRYLDRNYGGILILWDRLFGTFQPELPAEPCIYGVRKPLTSWNPLLANLQVYRETFRLGMQCERLVDRVGVWFRRPNWRPAALGGPVDLSDAALTGFRRYDPVVGPSTRRYVTVQFLCAVALTGSIALAGASGELGLLILPCIALWALLTTAGILLQPQATGLALEFARLSVLNPLLVLLASMAVTLPQPLLLTFGAYTTLSLVYWLRLWRAAASTQASASQQRT